MKGSPSSLPLPLFSFLFLRTISFLGHREGVARRMEYFVDGLNGGTVVARALTVILEIERKIISRVEGGNDSENRKESSRPCSQPWNNLHLSRALPEHLVGSQTGTPRWYEEIEICYVILGRNECEKVK